MTAIDPFNHGSAETLVSHVMPDEQQRAALGVMRRFAGTPHMRDMLAVLDLSDTADDMLLRRRQDLGQLVCTPQPPKLALVPSATRTGPGIRPQITPSWFNEQRTAATIERARRILAEIPVVEAPGFDTRGVVIPRCQKRLHHMVGDNLMVEEHGNACRACRLINRARRTLREHGMTP